MTGHTIAVAHWRALNREGEDTCRMARADHGWLLVGHARFRDDDGFAALDYVIRCDEAWHTLTADIAGQHGGQDVLYKIVNRDGVWLLNDALQPDAHGAQDVDLSFTPASNTMPLCRLAQDDTVGVEACAAWLQYPGARLKRLDQTYRLNRTAGLISYSAAQTGYETQLTMDFCGFTTHYPGLWQGEVTHEAP